MFYSCHLSAVQRRPVAERGGAEPASPPINPPLIVAALAEEVTISNSTVVGDVNIWKDLNVC